jgi:hypothetical protein
LTGGCWADEIAAVAVLPAPAVAITIAAANAVERLGVNRLIGLDLRNGMEVPFKFGGRAAEQFGQQEPEFPIGWAGHPRWSGRETAAARGANFSIGGINTFYYADLRPPIPATDRYLLIRQSVLIEWLL